ncbi:hypothetical protein [Photobacterium ganghwense]|uniref:hypothetical protein n=1 Tax=Photobacterium ganghwense TaxID=320778 RepID=UPI001C2D0AE9|nr:hypothetical protein [Photobacterium ganghwense]MBV1842211.1 hypothetical protein [Photobacterium ganghwense]
MADIRVYVNQGRYDEDHKKLLSIRKRAIERSALGVQDAVEQRLKKCHPKIYQRKIGQLYHRERDPKFNCYCNNPKSLDEVCRDILKKRVPYHALSCDACWQEDLSTTWGYYGFSRKIISKETWTELCDDRSYAKFVE